MKYVVIGGAGAMGKITVKDLFETQKDAIIIADYDFEKAQEYAASFKDKRVTAVKVDVRDHRQAAKAIGEANIILNSVQYQFNLDVMEIALALNAHYVDLGGLFHYTRKQMEYQDRFQKAGLLAILGVGAAPGITNLLACHGAEELDTLEEIHIRVGGVDETRYEPVPVLAVSYSLKTILEEFSYEPAVFTKGQFQFVKPMSGDTPHHFPKPVGVQKPMYTIHSEVATLPLSYKNKGVKEVSFKIAFAPEFVDRVRFLRDLGLASHEPITVQGVKVAPIDVVNKIAMSQPTPKQVGELKQYEVLRAVVKGKKKDEKLTIVVDCHAQGMPAWNAGIDTDTGCPPSVAAQMTAKKQITGTGVLAPEVCIPTKPFFAELEKRNMFVKVEKKNGWDFEV